MTNSEYVRRLVFTSVSDCRSNLECEFSAGRPPDAILLEAAKIAATAVGLKQRAKLIERYLRRLDRGHVGSKGK